jgi:hypothetical protein
LKNSVMLMYSVGNKTEMDYLKSALAFVKKDL